MKQILLDCRGFVPRTQLHKALADALSFPDRYGRNLDALHDLLTSIRQDTTLILENFPKEDPENAGVLRVLEDSQLENKHLTVQFL